MHPYNTSINMLKITFEVNAINWATLAYFGSILFDPTEGRRNTKYR